MSEEAVIEDILRPGAAALRLSLSEAQIRTFVTYADLLRAWNRRINLTRITNPAEVAVKHFLDSLSLVAVLPDGGMSGPIIDVGSGAGFPGLPLKIVYPELSLTLLETTAKKCRFLTEAVEALGLTGVTVVTGRAEEAGQNEAHRAQYAGAVARAVAPLPVLAEYTLPLVKVGGWVIAQKGLAPDEEIASAANALATLGGMLRQVQSVEVPELAAARHLVRLEKTAPTPADYPRRPGLPSKKPL